MQGSAGSSPRTGQSKGRSARAKSGKGRFVNALSVIAFVCSLLFVAFLIGFAVGEFKWFPHRHLVEAGKELKYLLQSHRHHLSPIRYPNPGATAYDPESICPGLTLLTGHFDGMAGIRLIDASGKVHHAWRTNPAEIWPESPYGASLAGRKNTPDNYVHGTYLFDNGDVLFNVEYMGLVRMDARGNVLWRLDRRTHHSITRTEDGNFWVCSIFRVEPGDERAGKIPCVIPPYGEEVALLVSPAGEVLREVNILDMLAQDEYLRLTLHTGERTGDLMHMNDVEPLPSSMADEYPWFQAGDLVVSLRNLHTIAVLDAQDGHVKWLDSDHWTAQHDPDFIGDGWIRVFDNNYDRTQDGSVLGGTRIVDIQPHTGQVRVAFPGAPDTGFYTAAGGKAQLLPCGHMLITEARPGRVLEVDSAGKIVWEWVQSPFEGDPSQVTEVLEGTRYDITVDTIQSWTGGE